VLAQTEPRFELIVVDDAGSMPVEAVPDPRVRVIRRVTRGGPSAARNTGIRAARGEYLAFLDDDDAYTPDRLELGLRAVARAPIGLCWRRPMHLPPGGERSVRGLDRGENRVLDGDVSDRIVEATRPHLGQVTIHRDVVPLFDERLWDGEDFEWWIRATAAAPAATEPVVGFLQRRHAGPRLTDRPVDERIAATELMLHTHRDYFARHPRSRAFQWRRIGELAEGANDHATAVRAYRAALGARLEARTAAKLGRSWLALVLDRLRGRRSARA
jgi:glycosyltransferase involved in cell wall biosynthesis